MILGNLTGDYCDSIGSLLWFFFSLFVVVVVVLFFGAMKGNQSGQSDLAQWFEERYLSPEMSER